jgi:hypothetical protein
MADDVLMRLLMGLGFGWSKCLQARSPENKLYLACFIRAKSKTVFARVFLIVEYCLVSICVHGTKPGFDVSAITGLVEVLLNFFDVHLIGLGMSRHGQNHSGT